MDELNYSRQLIKGNIAELIFQEMFRVSKEFTILPLGYEHTTPVIAQYQHFVHVQRVLENIRNAPDFALISQDKTKVFLVEVKYRTSFSQEEILNLATILQPRWDLCFLFVATKEKFYFSPCSWIIKNKGQIEELRDSWINKELQKQYMELLREFIR